MKTKVQTKRPTRYVIQQRIAGEPTSLDVLGHCYDGDPELAWLRFMATVRAHPDRYTPDSVLRLLLLARDGA